MLLKQRIVKQLKQKQLLCILLIAGLSAQAQLYTGGPNDGHSFALASNQPLGRNIFIGGIDDGADVAIASNQPLGRNIFRGGNDDGTNFGLASNQPLGRNIFRGGNDDGTNFGLASNQPFGRNIFRGGNDDGTTFGPASNQPLGRNISLGGANDGWAMAFAPNLEIIPVTLTDFAGQWQQKNALLSWKTASEYNSDHFELERSFDAATFVTIGSVRAAGQSNTVRSYQYSDLNIRNSLPSGITTVYYRLRSVDKDGKFTYSGIVVLRVDRNGNVIAYSIYPNPARDFVIVSASQPIGNDSYVILADVSGRVLQQVQMTSQRFQVNVSSYPSGTYFMRLTSAGKIIYTQKIIIQK